jgi:OPA family glycerol-3-phosphate transporter-like MFS transporter
VGESAAERPAGRLVRWRATTLAALFVGYAGYYVCRSNLSVAAPLLRQEFPAIGMTELGLLSTAGLVAYAVGKVVNGPLADLLGGRRMFLFGMVLSAACTAAFGLSAGLPAFMAVWVVNRFVQSMGWGALVGIAARWFPAGVYATVMGVLTLSYLLGDGLARLYLGAVLDLGVGWRGLFFVSAGTLGLIALAGLFTIYDRPADAGLPEPDAASAAPGATTGPPARGVRALLKPLLTNPTFWLVCAMNAGLTLIRETFNYWTPTYLRDEAGLDPAWAAAASAVFPVAGAVAALAAGALSDRLGGRHGRIAVPSLAALLVALLALALAPVRGHPGLAVTLIGAVGATLMAPYTFCSGVMAMDLGGRHGSGTACGLIDAAGYVGAVASGLGIGALAERYGWAAAFGALAGAAGLTGVVAVGYWLRQERAGARAPEEVRDE